MTFFNSSKEYVKKYIHTKTTKYFSLFSNANLKMGIFSDQRVNASLLQHLTIDLSYFLHFTFYQGSTGPLGLKGDEGPQGPPGDPAKGVRVTTHIFCKTVTRGCHNRTFISLKQIIGPSGKKGTRVSSHRFNALMDRTAFISRVHQSN